MSSEKQNNFYRFDLQILKVKPAALGHRAGDLCNAQLRNIVTDKWTDRRHIIVNSEKIKKNIGK